MFAVCGSNFVLVVWWANIVRDTGIWAAVETKNMRRYGVTFLNMTAISAPTTRNWLDMFVSSAEKYRRQARKIWVRGSIWLDQSVCATTATAKDEKRLFKGLSQTSDVRELGECRLADDVIAPSDHRDNLYRETHR